LRIITGASVLFAFLIGPTLSASMPGAQGHPHANVDAGAPAEILQVASRPIALNSNIGSAHDPVETTSAKAQAFYDQGLAYLHSYWWLEAARSFNQSLTLDPTLAVADAMLSIAYTELNAPQAAREAIAKANAGAARASDHDRRHIALRTMQMNAESGGGRWPDDESAVKFRESIDEGLKANPQDEELWLLRGLAESSDPAERGQGSGASSITFFKKALALAPFAHRRAPLPDARVRKHRANQARAHRGRNLCEDGAGCAARAAHVRPRPAAVRTY
jgi:tetratricopeptide (TPR) repeat protein